MIDWTLLSACPDCWVGRQARFSFFHAQFASHLLAVLSPFFVTALLSAWLTPFDRKQRLVDREEPK